MGRVHGAGLVQLLEIPSQPVFFLGESLLGGSWILGSWIGGFRIRLPQIRLPMAHG
jgi:hypothetical protein